MDVQKRLADRGICVHYDVEDFEQDVQHLRDRWFTNMVFSQKSPLERGARRAGCVGLR